MKLAIKIYPITKKVQLSLFAPLKLQSDSERIVSCMLRLTDRVLESLVKPHVYKLVITWVTSSLKVLEPVGTGLFLQ